MVFMQAHIPVMCLTFMSFSFLAASYTQLGAGTSGRAAAAASSTQQAAYTGAQPSWPQQQTWSGGGGGAQAAGDGSSQQQQQQTAAAQGSAPDEQFSEVFQMLNNAAGPEFGDSLGMFNAFSGE